jgi:cobalamin biosynthesis protein CobT
MDVAEVGLPLSEPNGEELGKTESDSTEETGEEDEEASDESEESDESYESYEEDEDDSDYDSDDYTDAEQSTENDILGERVLPPEFLKEVNKLSFEIYEMNEKGHIGKVDCENSKNAAVKNLSRISGIVKADQTLAKNLHLLSRASSKDYTGNFLLDTTQNYSMSLQVDQQRIYDLDNFHDLSDLKSFLLMTSYRQSTTSRGWTQYSDPKPNPDKLQ